MRSLADCLRWNETLKEDVLLDERNIPDWLRRGEALRAMGVSSAMAWPLLVEEGEPRQHAIATPLRATVLVRRRLHYHLHGIADSATKPV